MLKHTALYARVSTRDQTHASQIPDLQGWAKGQKGRKVYYRDNFTGRTMVRPAMDQLLADVRAGRVARVVVWRLDRLGRTAAGLMALLEELQRLGVGLVSLRDGFDLSTPVGRLLAGFLASIAEYETELRGERVAAGQAAARARGKTWGGSKPGWHWKVTPEKAGLVAELHARGWPVARIARTVGLSRQTVYQVLKGPRK